MLSLAKEQSGNAKDSEISIANEKKQEVKQFQDSCLEGLGVNPQNVNEVAKKPAFKGKKSRPVKKCTTRLSWKVSLARWAIDKFRRKSPIIFPTEPPRLTFQHSSDNDTLETADSSAPAAQPMEANDSIGNESAKEPNSRKRERPPSWDLGNGREEGSMFSDLRKIQKAEWALKRKNKQLVPKEAVADSSSSSESSENEGSLKGRDSAKNKIRRRRKVKAKNAEMNGCATPQKIFRRIESSNSIPKESKECDGRVMTSGDETPEPASSDSEQASVNLLDELAPPLEMSSRGSLEDDSPTEPNSSRLGDDESSEMSHREIGSSKLSEIEDPLHELRGANKDLDVARWINDARLYNNDERDSIQAQEKPLAAGSKQEQCPQEDMDYDHLEAPPLSPVSEFGKKGIIISDDCSECSDDKAMPVLKMNVIPENTCILKDVQNSEEREKEMEKSDEIQEKVVDEPVESGPANSNKIEFELEIDQESVKRNADSSVKTDEEAEEHGSGCNGIQTDKPFITDDGKAIIKVEAEAEENATEDVEKFCPISYPVSNNRMDNVTKNQTEVCEERDTNYADGDRLATIPNNIMIKEEEIEDGFGENSSSFNNDDANDLGSRLLRHDMTHGDIVKEDLKVTQIELMELLEEIVGGCSKSLVMIQDILSKRDDVVSNFINFETLKHQIEAGHLEKLEILEKNLRLVFFFVTHCLPDTDPLNEEANMQLKITEQSFKRFRNKMLNRSGHSSQLDTVHAKSEDGSIDDDGDVVFLYEKFQRFVGSDIRKPKKTGITKRLKRNPSPDSTELASRHSVVDPPAGEGKETEIKQESTVDLENPVLN